ncbi:hypothetical protein PGH07_01760 [Sulfurovum sp. zt1-1]|uniref:Uncharacterized protein n=1 Tax=Sulfurovum zhangzhouensis TaxID=3019067 RepID=A0ABT7QVN5_9BACT|nr:hypothetical protein [Sulfurovum zhangzhouensis]MDM5270899.1 hypothetical protein [Sulfurovum zhangzhouensis]
MNKEQLKEELLKLARDAFERASTLKEDQRIEVYLLDGVPTVSDILEEDDTILYGPNRILCYQVYGYPYLEDEIKTWIDYARVITQPTDDMPMPEPTDIEKSIREMIDEMAKNKQVKNDEISSYEVFANLPVNLLGSIEQQIIEYWWNAKEEENAKKLAGIQIDEGLASCA